jgi:Ala-tRNA(Pro) deacylase
MDILGIEPGSVTAFALINETSRKLSAVVVDAALMNSDAVSCHPLVNNATTRIATRDLIRFIEASGHKPLVLPLG